MKTLTKKQYVMLLSLALYHAQRNHLDKTIIVQLQYKIAVQHLPNQIELTYQDTLDITNGLLKPTEILSFVCYRILRKYNPYRKGSMIIIDHTIFTLKADFSMENLINDFRVYDGHKTGKSDIISTIDLNWQLWHV